MSTTTRPSSSPSLTTTVTVENPDTSSQPQQTLVLQLRPRKKVTWKEGTVDNEFMNKKSSKICCIYHKEKPFDEDDSDDEDHHHHHHHNQWPDGHDRKDGCGPSTSSGG